jgi:hypothetical protein
MSKTPKQGYSPASLYQTPADQPARRPARPYLSRSQKVRTCEGQVSFVFLLEPAQRMGAVSHELRRAYADVYASPDRSMASYLDGFILCMGMTYDIHFDLRPDAPLALFNFRDWWNGIQYGSYAAAFDSFIAGVDLDVNVLWSVARNQVVTGLPFSDELYQQLFRPAAAPIVGG